MLWDRTLNLILCVGGLLAVIMMMTMLACNAQPRSPIIEHDALAKLAAAACIAKGGVPIVDTKVIDLSTVAMTMPDCKFPPCVEPGQ